MPYGAHLIGYVDYVAAIIVFQNVEEATRKVNQVIKKKKNEVLAQEQRSQNRNGENTLILLTRKRTSLEIDITICGTTLTMRKVVHLGIRLDPKLTF